MRIATYEHGGLARVGLVADDVVHALPEGTSVVELLAAVPEQREAAAMQAARSPAVRLDEVRLQPPLRPPSIRDFVTFEQHVEGVVKNQGPDRRVVPEWYEAPTFYFSNPHSVIGAHDPVEIPPGCSLLDFELEVAAVVGRAARNLTVEQARNHIAGYTLFNDWSARDLQFHEMRVGLGPAKGKDFAITLGPWIVTADELEPHRHDDRLDLQLSVSVNGREVGSDTLAHMGWSFEEMLAYASRGAWVQPGDLLGSGTCGSGCLAELWGRAGRQEPRPLESGDVVTMTAEGIGTISNAVVEGVSPHPVPRARSYTSSS